VLPPPPPDPGRGEEEEKEEGGGGEPASVVRWVRRRGSGAGLGEGDLRQVERLMEVRAVGGGGGGGGGGRVTPSRTAISRTRDSRSCLGGVASGVASASGPRGRPRRLDTVLLSVSVLTRLWGEDNTRRQKIR